MKIAVLILMQFPILLMPYDHSERATPPNESLTGLYGYGLAKNFMQSKTLMLKYIDGMTLAFNWQDLEPQERAYDFSLILQELEWAKLCKKRINIVLYAGNRSPHWIYTKGVDKLTWKRRLKEDQARVRKTDHTQEQAPVFWNTMYLSCWKQLVSALSVAIRDHTSLGYVVITGATPKDYTTGTIIRYDDDWDSVISAGYTYEKHLTAWKDLVDHYTKQFADQHLVLALGPLRPGTSDLSLSTDLVDYIIEHQYKQVHFLSVNLNDTWFQQSEGSRKLRDLLKYAKRHGHSFGYQLIYSVHRNNTFSTSPKLIHSLENTLALGIDDGASWIEVWHDDIILPNKKETGTINPAFASQLETARNQIH
jgi:hypothetical protein